jgi:hypothetical protein
VRQEATEQGCWQSAAHIRRQRAEDGAALGDPAEALLEHRNSEIAVHQVADDQGQQGPVGSDVGAQQNAGWLRPEPFDHHGLQQRRG